MLKQNQHKYWSHTVSLSFTNFIIRGVSKRQTGIVWLIKFNTDWDNVYFVEFKYVWYVPSKPFRLEICDKN